MNKLLKLLLISILIFSINIWDIFAYKKSEIPKLLNDAIQSFDKDKKNMILEKEKVIEFLKTKLNRFFLNSYVYNNIKKYTYNWYHIIDNVEWEDFNRLEFEYNKYNLLDKEMLKLKKEQLRDYLVKKLIEQNIVKIEQDISQFDLEIFLWWTMTVKKNNTKITKNNLLDMYIDTIFESELWKLKKISDTNISQNIYYNYLYDNNIKGIANFNIDLKKFKNTIIVRNEEDFKKLFKLTSYRFRSGYKWDTSYRKYNILQVYDTIKWNKLVLYPNETMSFNNIYKLNDIWYTKYLNGIAIINGEEKKWVYGWWVCWAATWFYQWALYNKNIKSATRNHSLWYNLYVANINGNVIRTPWLDSTYFGDVVDLKMTNTSKYPIILVNRIFEGIEENFTISMVYEKDDKISNLKFISRNKNCFTWLIDWKYKTSCYKDIMPEKYAKEAAEKIAAEKALLENSELVIDNKD